MAPTLTSLGRQPGAWSSSSSRQAGPSSIHEGRITGITVTVITEPRWPLPLWTLHYLKQVTADREVKHNQHRFRQESWWFALNTFPQPGCRHEFWVNHHLWSSYPQQNKKIQSYCFLLIFVNLYYLAEDLQYNMIYLFTIVLQGLMYNLFLWFWIWKPLPKPIFSFYLYRAVNCLEWPLDT